LRSLGFNPVFLTSEKANLQKLKGMLTGEVRHVRNVFKEISAGVYRKRLWSSHQAYMSKERFNDCVDKVSLKKLAKMFRILGFLTQTKVYLFWEKHQS